MINLYGNEILDPNDPDDYELLINLKKLGTQFRAIDARYLETSMRDKAIAGRFAWHEDTNEKIHYFLWYRVDDGHMFLEIKHE